MQKSQSCSNKRIINPGHSADLIQAWQITGFYADSPQDASLVEKVDPCSGMGGAPWSSPREEAAWQPTEEWRRMQQQVQVPIICDITCVLLAQHLQRCCKSHGLCFGVPRLRVVVLAEIVSSRIVNTAVVFRSPKRNVSCLGQFSSAITTNPVNRNCINKPSSF